MSHFTVAVFSHDIEDVDMLLAPFDENTEDPQYLEFMVSSFSKQEALANYEENKQEEETFEDFVSREYGYLVNESGDVGYYANSNAKWDWYQVGGRWFGALKLKPGCSGFQGSPSFMVSGEHEEGTCDQALVRDVDFSMDQDAYDKAIRFWEVVVDGDARLEGEDSEDFYSFLKPSYYIERWGTKENYARSQASFGTWAFLTPDGEWVENGRMGWFACSDATKESRKSYAERFSEMIANSQDLYITIVDCHI